MLKGRLEDSEVMRKKEMTARKTEQNLGKCGVIKNKAKILLVSKSQERTLDEE